MALTYRCSNNTFNASAVNQREISFPIGPNVHTPDSAYILGVETDRLYREVDDQSIVHHAYMPVPLSLVKQAAGFNVPAQTALTYWALEVGGANWTGMPSGGSVAAVLHSSDGASPFPLSIVDPAASPSDMNSIRRLESDYGADPVPLTESLSYMLELQSPRNGTGSSRYVRFYRVIIRTAPIVVVNGIKRYVEEFDIPTDRAGVASSSGG